MREEEKEDVEETDSDCRFQLKTYISLHENNLFLRYSFLLCCIGYYVSKNKVLRIKLKNQDKKEGHNKVKPLISLSCMQ